MSTRQSSLAPSETCFQTGSSGLGAGTKPGVNEERKKHHRSSAAVRCCSQHRSWESAAAAARTKSRRCRQVLCRRRWPDPGAAAGRRRPAAAASPARLLGSAATAWCHRHGCSRRCEPLPFPVGSALLPARISAPFPPQGGLAECVFLRTAARSRRPGAGGRGLRQGSCSK